MGVAWFSSRLRGVGVVEIESARLDRTCYVQAIGKVRVGAGVPSTVAGVFIAHHCLAARVDVTGWVTAAMQELFREDDKVDLWVWILETMELPSGEKSLTTSGIFSRHCAGRSSEFPDSPRICAFWRFARVKTLCMTRVGWVYGI